MELASKTSVRFSVNLLGSTLGRRALSLLLLALTTASIRAQGGPALSVRPLHGQDTFRVGERIPLELSFTSTIPGRYELNMASYDRSGRMPYEHFAITPEKGWADPLARYYEAGGVGGGLSSFQTLIKSPSLIQLDLNDWIRFDQPGTYTVKVTSQRVTDSTKSRFPADAATAALTAEPFVLHIVPATAPWQAEKLAASLRQLAPARTTSGPEPPERGDALADLRFLGTEAAVDALAANLRDDRPEWIYESAFGLMGVPKPLRDYARATLRDKIRDPLFPVSGWFMETLSALEPADVTPEPIFVGRSRAHERVWREVLLGLPTKTGAARATTVKTLLSGAPPDAGSRAQLGAVLSASYASLNEEQQFQVLMYNWDSLRSPSILPDLQTSARLPLTNPGSNAMSVYNRRSLKSMALARWYELDPEGAKQEILLQVGSATPSLTTQSLWFLPDGPLPQFEQLWTQRFLQSEDIEEEAVLAGLLVRFGTGSASDQVAGKLRIKVGNWACAPQAAALAYLVKFDPGQARALLQQALAAGHLGKTGCHQTLFPDVAAHTYAPVLNEAAVSSLDNADRRVAMAALIYLASYGRKEDREPIWNRYVQWHEQWEGKADTLDAADQASLERNYPEIGLGENLAHALVANQGWLADRASSTRVVEMCIGQRMCQQVKQSVRFEAPFPVNAFRYGIDENYQIGQYTAKSKKLFEQKIAQYPTGTSFRVHSTSPQSGDQSALEQELRNILQNKGMVIAPPLKAGS